MKFAVITFTAATLIALAITPVHAGEVVMVNYHKQNAYAMMVTFSLLGENTVSSCAPGGGNNVNVLTDAVRAANKIVVYKTDRCLNGMPGNRIGSVLKEYNVPNNPSINRKFGIQIEEDGRIDIREINQQ